MVAPVKIQRRVAGKFDYRLDGIGDLLTRCGGLSVLDVGCNRGLVGLEFARNGATKVHGCDIDADCINVCNHNFIDLRSVNSRFEIVDLTQVDALKNFDKTYDIVVVLAVIHKLARIMEPHRLGELIQQLGRMTTHYLGWRATAFDKAANQRELAVMDEYLKVAGLTRVQYSELSDDIGPSAIWRRLP